MGHAQLCPTLCNLMDCSLPGSSVHGIHLARILEWVAVPFSRDLPNPGMEPRSPALQADSLPAEPQRKQQKKVKMKSLSRLRLSATLWTVAYQAPPSTGFSRQEYWSGLPFPSPVDHTDPRVKPGSLTVKADSLPTEPPVNPFLK